MWTKSPSLSGICLSFIIGSSSPAYAEETSNPPPKDPVALEIVTNAAEFLAGQQDISVNWFVSYDDIVEGREKITHTRSGQVLVSRDGGFYSYAEDGLKTREFFFDGTSFTAFDPDKNVFAQVLFSGDFEALVTRARAEFDLDLPIWSILSTTQGGRYAEAAEQIAYLGLTRIGGEYAHHIALTNYDEDWQLWISDDPDAPHLLMIVGTDPYIQGWPQYRAYFSNWDFAPEIVEGAYVFTPDDQSEQMAWPKAPRE